MDWRLENGYSRNGVKFCTCCPVEDIGLKDYFGIPRGPDHQMEAVFCFWVLLFFFELSAGHVVYVSEVLLLEDGLVHAALASLSETFSSDEVVQGLVFVVADDVASTRSVFDTLVSNGAFRSGLAEGEVAIDGRKTNEELSSGFAREERFSLLLVDITVEPLLFQGFADLVEEGVAFLVGRGNGTKPVKKTSKIVDVDCFRWFDEFAGLMLTNQEATKTFEIYYSLVGVVQGIRDGNSQELQQFNRKFVPRSLSKTVTVQKLLSPEQTSIGILNRNINQNDI